MKKAISLIVLGFVIVILSILAGITAFSASDTIRSSKLTNFTTNMSKIQDAVSSYYATRGTLPIKDGSSEYNASSMVAIVASQYQSNIIAEIEKNGDTNSTFYQLDVQKIGVQKAANNIGADGTLLVNTNGTHVYYINGYKINKDVFFSITNDLK